MLSVEVDGVNYESAISITVSRSIKNFLGSFTVRSSSDPNNLIPIKIGQQVRILADGTTVMVARADKINVSQDANSHIITFGGRDITNDAFDSTVEKQLSFDGPIEFIDVLRQVLDNGNMQFIDIINEAGDIDSFSETDIISSEVGTRIFDFLEPYARKRQFIMTTNEFGNVLLLRAGSSRLGTNLIRDINNPSNNILSSDLDINIEKRFNSYNSSSQLNPFGAGDEVSPSDIANQSGESDRDPDIRESRNLTFNAEEDLNNEESFNRAQFEANIRRANSLEYSCTLQGHTINGELIRVNRVAFVQDLLAGVSSDMLIYGIQYRYDLDSGSTTRLSMTTPDAFTLDAQRSAREAARSLIGDGF